MLQRCPNAKHPRYQDYGGRGIFVAAAWQNFKEFLADMGDCPAGYALDRINNEDGYYKMNCRWATYKENNSHKRKYSNNTSGCKGVSYSRGLWIAYACKDGKRIRLGSSRSKDAAIKLRTAYDLQT
jgi:hypothetical protein